MKLDAIRDIRDKIGFAIDIFMIFLVAINLTWIIFEWHFTFQVVQDIFKEYTPAFFNFYNSYFHKNFLQYDFWFVIIFISELSLRWAIAIYRKTHYKWFFYPFIHWYEVLGCIPLGTFRVLRLLRVFSMIFRLQKLGVINLTKTYAYKIFKKYYDVAVEEVSDRVVVNMLEGIQFELMHGTPVTDRMIKEVVQPHKADLVEWMSHRVRLVTSHNYEIHKKELKIYTQKIIQESVKNNVEIKELKTIPMIGPKIANSIEKSVAGITYSIFDKMVADIGSEHNHKIIEELTDSVIEMILLEDEDKELDKITHNIAYQALEIIKDQVKVQQWKIKEQKEKATQFDKKLSRN